MPCPNKTIKILTMKATIAQNEIKVEYSIRPDIGREFLTIDIEGWDDVKKILKKVLVHEGKKFTFTGWCSDKNKCYFAKPINGEAATAKIK